MENRTYIAIDLKSFYASVECVERGLNPLTTNLVVADATRTHKTICLAVSPSLKAHGVPGRARLFEVIQQVKMANAERLMKNHIKKFEGTTYDDVELRENPNLAIDYIIAPPKMAFYMEYSSRVYGVYLKHIAPEDIHVYSIDEVFIDATSYLKANRMNAYDFARMIVQDVLETTGITATAGIGTNLYLAKVAMDIVAKHIPADEDGVRIAVLDERSYREKLWNHRPLTDFWRIGRGYERSLEKVGLRTMGDVARCSMGRPNEFYNENLLYKIFGINAELLIDHAWGVETCTIADIKAYKPEKNSISSGQVLPLPYSYKKAELVVREMTDLLVLDLVDKGLVTDRMTLVVGYDTESLKGENVYTGEVTTDHYGRKIPRHARGTVRLGKRTSSTKLIMSKVAELFAQIVDPELFVRRIYITAEDVIDEKRAKEQKTFEQLDIFTDYEALEKQKEKDKVQSEKERKVQQTVLQIKKKYGKNAILKGMNLQEDATAVEQNNKIGGHKA